MSNGSNIVIPFPEGDAWKYRDGEQTLDAASPLRKAIENDVLHIIRARSGWTPTLALTDKATEWMDLTGLQGRVLGGKTKVMICFDDYYAAGLFKLAFEL